MITFETIGKLELATLKEGDLVQVLGEFSEGDVALMTGKVYPALHNSSNRLVTIANGLKVEIFPTPLGDKDVTKKYVNERDDKIKEQVNNLHTKREAIEWKAGLRVTDELQLYVHDGVEYLPDSKAVPFTTGSNFADDVAVGRFSVDNLLTRRSGLFFVKNIAGLNLYDFSDGMRFVTEGYFSDGVGGCSYNVVKGIADGFVTIALSDGLIASPIFDNGTLYLEQCGVIDDNGVTDNGLAFAAINKYLRANNHINWIIKTNLTGEIHYTKNRLVNGVRHFTMIGGKLRNVSNDAWTDNNCPLYSGSLFSANQDTTPSDVAVGVRFKSAKAGDSSIQLVNPADANKFGSGAPVLLYGFNTQWGGQPINARYFDHLTVKSVVGDVVHFNEKLTCRYDENWKDFDPSNPAKTSAPRIISYRRSESTWGAESQCCEYAKFENVEFLLNTSSYASFNFNCRERVTNKCKFEMILFAAQTSKYCETTLPTCLRSIEFDKLTTTCVLNQPNAVGINSATGVMNLTVNDGSLSAIQVAPRVCTLNNVDLTAITGQTATILKHPQNQCTRSYVLNQCTIAQHNEGISHEFFYSTRLLKNQWNSRGNGEILVKLGEFSGEYDFFKFIAGIDIGSVAAFLPSAEGGAWDYGTVKSVSYSGKDLVVGFEDTNQFSLFNNTEIRFKNTYPDFRNCTYSRVNVDYSDPTYLGYLTGAQQGTSNSFKSSPALIKTIVLDKYSLQSNTPVLSLVDIISITVDVKRAYTGEGNGNLWFANIGGGVNGSNPTKTVSLKTVGVTEITKTDLFLQQPQCDFRCRLEDGKNIADWRDPVKSANYSVVITYLDL